MRETKQEYVIVELYLRLSFCSYKMVGTVKR